MSSVTDLINFANFQRSQSQDSAPQKISELAKTIKDINDRRSKQEQQKKLSDLLKKDIGNLESEYTVDETGNISVKYKTKKKDSGFAEAVKNAAERIADGEDYELVAGELSAEYPKNINTSIETYLNKFVPVVPEKKEIIPQTEVGRFDPRRMLPSYSFSGNKTQNRVKVKDKDGKEYTLPVEQLEEAVKQGYILIR